MKLKGKCSNFSSFFQHLRIDLEAYPKDGGEKRYAEYSSFSVGDETDNYRLSVIGFVLSNPG